MLTNWDVFFRELDTGEIGVSQWRDIYARMLSKIDPSLGNSWEAPILCHHEDHNNSCEYCVGLAGALAKLGIGESATAPVESKN